MRVQPYIRGPEWMAEEMSHSPSLPTKSNRLRDMEAFRFPRCTDCTSTRNEADMGQLEGKDPWRGTGIPAFEPHIVATRNYPGLRTRQLIWEWMGANKPVLAGGYGGTLPVQLPPLVAYQPHVALLAQLQHFVAVVRVVDSSPAVYRAG